MISQQPYLIRAIYEWCIDNNLTPYIAAKVDDNVVVPMQYVQNNQIVLNIGNDAIKDLNLDNKFISFNARFEGNSKAILIPVANVIAIFAKENGEGMEFSLLNETTTAPAKSEQQHSGLKLVK
jgi:stringent starvation protein B